MKAKKNSRTTKALGKSPATRPMGKYVLRLYMAGAASTTNLLGPIRLTAALLPLLQKQPRATIMNVSSGLAFVPLAMTPAYLRQEAVRRIPARRRPCNTRFRM